MNSTKLEGLFRELWWRYADLILLKLNWLSNFKVIPPSTEHAKRTVFAPMLATCENDIPLACLYLFSNLSKNTLTVFQPRLTFRKNKILLMLSLRHKAPSMIQVFMHP